MNRDRDIELEARVSLFIAALGRDFALAGLRGALAFVRIFRGAAELHYLTNNRPIPMPPEQREAIAAQRMALRHAAIALREQKSAAVSSMVVLLWFGRSPAELAEEFGDAPYETELATARAAAMWLRAVQRKVRRSLPSPLLRPEAPVL